MKTFLQLALALLVLLSPWRGWGQSFVNLNFEQGTIVTNLGDPYVVSVAIALPGWSVYGYPGSGNILYNNTALGAPCVSIYDGMGLYSRTPFEGRYVLGLQPPHANFYTGSGSIFQTGTVPLSAQSIRFYGSQYGAGIHVYFAGQELSVVTVENRTGYNVYGANIGAFAGQLGELRFDGGPYGGGGGGPLDNIFFSTQAVPEPSTWALLGLGTLFFARALRRQNR